jgi:long-chain fatty acid transport protein
MNNPKRLLALAVSAAIMAPLSAFATNGMNMEGYGPIATGMGGASMAYENGTAGMMNNPATLGLADDGNRLDVAWGYLGPNVDAEFGSYSWDSKGDAYNMPALGWVKNDGMVAYGFGGFAQGGMGTEFEPTSTQAAPGAAFFFVPPSIHPFGGSMMGNALSPTSSVAATAMGWEEMSEVGVMRILIPFNYRVNEKLNLGASIDYVRANMDLKMAMDGNMMWNMMDPTQQDIGTMSGSMTTALQGAMGLGMFDDVYGGYFDFADSNPYSGEATGDGFAGKLGFVYQLNSQLTIGGTYHTQTALDDLSGDAKVTMLVSNFMGSGSDEAVTMNGDIKIKDFQWPSTYGFGMSYVASDKLMIAADIKHIRWADVMENFNMSFTANGNAGTPAAGFDGTTLDAVMFQDWKNQTAFQIGGSYKATDKATVRAGLNIANNPIPDATLHYLFPAVVKNHATLGFGYEFDQANDVNFSLTYAPEVEQTNDMGMTITHSQTNWQLMYSYKY